MKTLSSLLALGLISLTMIFGATGNRKVTENKLSPSADTSVTLGGHAITIEYNAPAARGRQVEGGLIPYDKVWRLGADSATTLTTDTDIMIGNLMVPKGVHTLYLQAAQDRWLLIVNKQVNQWGTVYTEGQDLGRVPMKVQKLSQPVESLRIALKPDGAKKATLEVAWGTTSATVPITVK